MLSEIQNFTWLQFRQSAIPVQMFSPKVSLFIFLLLIDWIIAYDTTILEYKMEAMGKLIERKESISPEHNLLINNLFVRAQIDASFCLYLK